jgi:serine/threonine protein kinase/Tfp pilus assembly protein PilF
MTASASIHPECPRCGAKMAADAPEGLCVRCLARLNFTADSVFTGAEAPRSEPPSLEEIAAYFPQLEVLACLGRGGMGVVYKARQRSLDRLVALKVLAPEREKEPQFAERFAREAQALAKLSHPHIVTIYDFGQADGLFYLLMEYVDGVNLRQLLRTRRLESKEALAIVPQICDALQYAHDHAVVHRDVKPENLLLDKAGQVKIADFGIAKILGGDGTPDEEQGVGTPHYMAPEQQATPQAADHRADIYSLGVVLYEMLTGEMPTGQFERPSRKVQIDVRLDEIVLCALNREPELRFQQAGQMKTAVETLTRAGPEIGSERPPSVSSVNRSRFPKFRGTRATNVRMAIAITLVLLFLAAGMGILGKARDRFSGNSANVRDSSFAEEAKRGSDAFEREAIRFNPEIADLPAYKSYSSAAESLGPKPQGPKFGEVAKRGLGAFHRADFDQAIVAFDELIRLDPRHSEAHRWRGDASLNKHELDRALSEYEDAIRLDTKNGMAYCGRGAAATGKGDFDQAIASFDEAIRLDPKIGSLSFYKSHRAVAESLRPFARKAKFAEEAKRGSDAFERRDYDQAIVAWDKAIRIDPKHSEAHRWRGDASLNKHELEKALSEYDEALRLDPNNGMAYCCRGAAWTEKGEYDKAIAALDEAIRLDPEIAKLSFYKRYRKVAEFPSFGVLIGILIIFGLCFVALDVWLTLRRRKPKVDKDF